MLLSPKLRLAAVVIAVALLPATPSPAEPVPTTISTPNVTHLKNIPTGSGVGGKFAGGFFFHTTTDPKYFGRGSDDGQPGKLPGGLVVLSAAVPEHPIPVGYLSLPIWQNEDVELSLKRNVLLIAEDATAKSGGILHVIDITIPVAPRVRSTVKLPQVSISPDRRRLSGGAGHTASCILDCNFAYVSGAVDGSLWVVDLRSLDTPRIAGTITTPAGTRGSGIFGSVHDVHTDPNGQLWVTGLGGTALYAPIVDPLRPQLLASVAPADNTRLNQFIHHGALRLSSDTVLITEEAFGKAGCGKATSRGEADEDGSLQTWRIDVAKGSLRPLTTFDVSIPGPEASKRTCSSHWFDFNQHRVVADAWYEGGVRFLDASNPNNLRQIGWWMGKGTFAGAAQFVPGRPDLVYVSDYQRGLDILKIENGGKGAATVKSSVVLPERSPRAELLTRTMGCNLRDPRKA